MSACEAHIPLNRGAVALIDTADLPLVGGVKWTLHSGGYAYRHSEKRNVYMHRVILGNPQGFEVDHINGDKLDNRRANLRTATRRQNQANTRAWAKASALKGVYPDRCGRWRAQIKVGDHHVYLGAYRTKEEAGLVFDGAARIVHGVYARTNFKGVDDAS